MSDGSNGREASRTDSPGDAPRGVELAGVEKRFDNQVVVDGVSLSVRPGEFLALLGGSGCGKTTLLRLIAGLERPDAGRISIGGVDVTGTPPNRRPVNMMFQSYAVFPHLDVAGNIEYGLRAARTPRAERDRLVAWALDLVQLPGFARRRTAELSGGQRQRVALARCLVKRPSVLLLDEPMAALDRNLREDMQRELVRIQRDVGTTFILVTHDQDEAMSMADRIAVMQQGRIVQCGTPVEVYERPASRFVARFVGRVNLLDAVVAGSEGRTMTLRLSEHLRIRAIGGVSLAAGQSCAAAIRPEKVLVSTEPTGLANDLGGTLEGTMFLGDSIRVTLRLEGGVHFEGLLGGRERDAILALSAGARVHVGFDAESVVVLPP